MHSQDPRYLAPQPPPASNRLAIVALIALLGVAVLMLICGGIWYNARLSQSDAEIMQARQAEIEALKQRDIATEAAREAEAEALRQQKLAQSQTASSIELLRNYLRLKREQQDPFTAQALQAQEEERSRIRIKAAEAGVPVREYEAKLGTDAQRFRFETLLKNTEDAATGGATARALEILVEAETLYPGDPLSIQLREKIRHIETAKKVIEAQRAK